MKVIVCGGRNYNNQIFINDKLDELHIKKEIKTVIQGGASGADFCAGIWAKNKSIEVRQYDAEWKIHGRGAGAIRNRRMLYDGKPDLVVAFPGGKGTTDMKRQARNAGVQVIEYSEEDQLSLFPGES